MAYGEGAVGTDGNRGIHARSYEGDDVHMPDTAIPVNSLAAPSNNLLGEPSMNGPSGRQEMPAGVPGGAGIHDVAGKMSGESELLGQNPHEGIKDDAYPNLASIPLPGDPDGYEPVNWDAVGTYEYPEFGEQPSPKSGAGDSALPYT